jgi:glycerol-3-phosphate acyltransferase PlsY
MTFIGLLAIVKMDGVDCKMEFSSILVSLFLVLLGYLCGSIPTAYVVGKWLKGIDLREYGSGTVSTSMVWEHVAHWVAPLVGIFDILKAAFPAWLGMKLGSGPAVATIAGLAAVIGHNWPIFLHFTGGRGISPFMGLLLVIFPWGFPWLLAFLSIGYVLGDSAPWGLASLVTMPVLAHWAGGLETIRWAAGAMVLITLVKRLEANGRPLPKEAGERRKMILLRLFFDRDMWNHPAWIRRTPDSH